MAALGTLASGIAHEINNPLTYVIANLQTLADRLPASSDQTIRDLSEVVADALQGAERIRRLVKEVQMVSPGQHAERLANVALRDPLRTALALTENQIKHRARLVCALEPDVYVRGDHERIEQLFVNLLLNAAQAIPEGQAHENEIRVERARAARTGHGDRPNRGHRSRHPARGSGDGSSSRSSRPSRSGKGPGWAFRSAVASSRALGGQISFQSEPAGGTTFRVVLPTTDGPA